MNDNQSINESTLPSSNKLVSMTINNKPEIMNDHISVEQSQIDYCLSQIPVDPPKYIAELLKISDKQYININNQFIPDIMSVLSDAYASDDYELRKNIFQLLKNISDKLKKNDRSFCDDLSDPTYISLLWNDFPNNYYSAQLLAKIVDGNPTAAEYIISHKINEQQMQFLMSPDNPSNIIENVLIFFSAAFSSIKQYIPNMMDMFVDFTCNLITNCNTNDDFIDDLPILEKMAKSFEEVATKLIPFLPTICNFDEYDEIANMNVNSLLEACVTKLESYEIFTEVDPGRIIYFIIQCLAQSTDGNDYSAFSALKLLTAVEDLSPFDKDPESAEIIFENLASVISRDEKYELKENAVLSVCRLIKYANESEIENFLKVIDFSFIFEFAEQENPIVQKAILEAVINIDYNQSKESNGGSSDFITNLLYDEVKMNILTDLTKSENEKIAQYANLIIEKANY